MPGIQDFTYANYGKETTRGTTVAPTRQLYAEGTGVLKPSYSKSFHEGENRGIRIPVVRSTTQAQDVALKLTTPDDAGISWDDFVLLMAWLKGGLTGVGAGADKTWTCTPNIAAGTTNAPEAFSFDVGDDIQNWRVGYVMATKITLSAEVGGLTQCEVEAFGKSETKVAKATPGPNASPKIPGDLWTIKFAATLAGLAGASVVANFLRSWKLEIMTGILWRHYMDGTLTGAQHVETSIQANLELVVESTAQAVSQFYDKHVADTLDFIRLKATGGALGGSNYSQQIDLPVLYDTPSIIDSEEDGVNLWKIPAKMSADSPTAPTQGLSLIGVNSLAAIP